MASVSEIRRSYDEWRELCEKIQNATFIAAENPRQRQARIKKLRADYAAFVNYYFPHYTTDEYTGISTPSAPFHIKAANTIRADRNFYGAFVWHRGAAKSTHMDIFIPMWLMCQEKREINVMVLVGKSEDNAINLLADIQAELQYNQRYIADFGEQYNNGFWGEGKFVTKSGVAFFARGRGQSPRGLRHRSHRPDYIVIDDLDDDKMCKNPALVKELTDWTLEALYGALDGGRGRFIMVGNLIAKNSVLANFIANDATTVSRVNILDNKGNVSWASKYTIADVQRIQSRVGYRSFQREYMNNPITTGAVFREEWIKWKQLPSLSSYDALVLYIDPSFKGTTKNDYKAAKLWGKIGTELHHIRAFVRQCSISEMVRWLYDLYDILTDNGIAIRWYMEANFMQDLILDEFRAEGDIRGYQLPLSADRRKKPDKFQRIEAISPLWERGFVFYNQDEQHDPDMQVGLAQTLAFEKGMRGHDDAPDADEGAIWYLQRSTRTKNQPVAVGRRRNNKNKLW